VDTVAPRTIPPMSMAIGVLARVVLQNTP